jgi:hypothetical protein
MLENDSMKNCSLQGQMTVLDGFYHILMIGA